MADPFIDSIESYLRAGKVEPSCHLILQAAERADFSRSELARVVCEALERLLESFVIRPVLRFWSEMDTNLPGEIAAAVTERIGRRVELINDWSKRIEMIGRERLADELRAAVRSGEFDQADVVVARLLGPTGVANPTPSALGYIGSLLGSVEHGQRQAERLIANWRSGRRGLKLTEEQVEVVESARRTRTGGAVSEFREAEFVRELNNMAVEMKRWLPGPRVTGAATEEQIVRFYHALHAVASSVFLDGDSGRWADATLVLVEFCPRELSEAGRRAGVEARAYMTITPTARRVVFEAFGRLGRNEILTKSYLEFASSVKNERLKRNALEVMGAMHAKPFLQYFRRVFESEETAGIRGVALVAASNFADGDSAEFLLNALRRAITKGQHRGVVPEGPHRREAVEALFALGRIVRSPRMDPGGRNEILKRAIAAMPEHDRRLQHELACQFFMTPSEGWDPRLRDWAATTLTRSLWLGEMTPEFAEGDERQKNILGERNRTVQALVALGREAIQAILHTCEESELRYGGAYIALAETFSRLGSAEGLDLLERLLANALLHDDSGRTKYQAETYYDSTEGVRKKLTPDQVVSALLFAIEKIGGEQADMILVRAHTQILAPGARSPGPETDEVLERVRARLVRNGKWNDMLRKAGERRTDRPSGERDEAGARRAAAVALKELRTKGLWRGRRREKKIGAIQTLAAQRNLEAIPLIIEFLDNSDPMIRAAAETALGEYAWAATNDSVRRALTYALLDALSSRNERIREVVRGILHHLGPHREPLHSKLVAISRGEPDALLRAEASRLLREDAGADVLESLGSEEISAEAPEAAAGESEEAARQAAAKMSIDEKIRLKREYLEARRAWIAGGKKGDPPEPPPGI